MVTRWKDSDLQTCLYRWYISEREPGTMEIKEIAELIKNTEYGIRWGYSSRTIYNYLNGEDTPPPEFITSFYEVTKDRKIVMWFITRFPDVTIAFHGVIKTNGSVDDEALKITSLIGSFAKQVIDATRDGHIDSREKESMMNTLLDMRHEIDVAIEELKVSKVAPAVTRTKAGFHFDRVTK